MTRHLPVELTTFVGRRKELAESRRMVRAARLVTIVGPGGVGKTRLATRLAHQVVRVFPHGVVWVDLAAQRDPGALASEVASALGVEPQGHPALEAIATYLASRELLLVLDNCEQLADACSDLLTSLLPDATDLRVVATSRQPLKVTGEHVMSLEPLAVPTPEEVAAGGVGHVEAVALLVDRARMVDAGFRLDSRNAELITRLVRGLDGIPLAIELAAARLRVLSVSQLVERLDDRFGLLSAGTRATSPRHQTLRALIEWSYDLCSPAEQALWARMSVFDGGADLEAVESVCGETAASALELLAGLADKSVVTVSQADGRVRFRMLETIREYGAEILAQRGETEPMRDRHRDHYLASARKAQKEWFGPDQLDLLARTTTDLGNLRATFDHTLSLPDDRTAALELASAVAWYWEPAGALDEGARWFARALGDEQADAADASPTRLRTLADAVHLCAVRNDADAALPLGRRAAALPTPEPTAADRAARHLARAHLATVTGNHDGALASDHQALRAFRAAGNLLKQVEVLQGIATITDVLGRPAEAAAALEQAIHLCDTWGERFERRAAMQYYGFVHYGLGRYEQAFTALRASLTAWPVLRPNNVAQALWAIAKTHAALDQNSRAAVLLGARVRIRDEFGYALSPYTNESFEAFERRLSGAIGEKAFRSAYDEGYAMNLETAVQFALGQETTARPRRQMGGTSPLSKREDQVAELVARGLSNKDIAQELVISQRTAEGHVAKVMEKLGVHSREQVAGWVTERRGSATW